MTESSLSNRPMALGPDDAVTSLWHEFGRPLRAFLARRLPVGGDVDDVLQDVFVRVQRGIGGLRETERVHAWIFQVARSALADTLRTQPTFGAANLAAIESSEVEVADSEDTPERLLALCVAPMIDHLDDPYREALLLTEVEGLTQSEAARRVGITLTAMKSRVQRARAQLKERIIGCCRIDVDARGGVIGYELREPTAFDPNAMGCRPLSPCKKCE